MRDVIFMTTPVTLREAAKCLKTWKSKKMETEEKFYTGTNRTNRLHQLHLYI